MWDRRSGEPLHNALVWQDTRVDQLVAEYVRDGGPNRFRAKTGLPMASYFSALKLQWILDNVPGARGRAKSGDVLFGNIDTWLLWNLTGGSDGGLHFTDVTNASRTQLMNLESLQWDGELLDVFKIPARGSAAHRCFQRIVRRGQSTRASRRVNCGYPRRSAGCVGRPGLLSRRRGKKHLRDGMFSFDEHR